MTDRRILDAAVRAIGRGNWPNCHIHGDPYGYSCYYCKRSLLRIRTEYHRRLKAAQKANHR